ncbi:2OG-Fe(II) oxygenase [Patulibacter minatonensis]|nr:2OG-Fe(II) oxygenase [Patulibacter minatonensis]
MIFPTRERSDRGRTGHHRIGLRHGVSTVTAGTRTALGTIFHDAK